MDTSDIEKSLVGEIGLEPLEAKIFLLITLEGKMAADDVASRLGVAPGLASRACRSLVGLGGLIDMSPAGFEAMHPRFTAVNMYRRMCERRNIEFGRNKTVDGIGAMLERHYDDARTK